MRKNLAVLNFWKLALFAACDAVQSTHIHNLEVNFFKKVVGQILRKFEKMLFRVSSIFKFLFKSIDWKT